MTSISAKKEHIRFLKFAIVGISGTVVDFGIFNLLAYLFNYSAFINSIKIDSVLLASMISFIVAVFNNYYWNRNWTYPESKEFSHKDQLFKFGVVSVLGLVIRTPLFALIKEPIITYSIEIIKQSFLISPEIVGQNIALVIVVLIVLFWNYFINRFWTYRHIE